MSSGTACSERIRNVSAGPDVAKVNGIDIAYDVFGDEEAAPLLLIMGYTSQMIVWDDPFCEELASRGYRVIRFDNRDVGLSSKLDHKGVPDIAALLRGEEGSQAEIPYTLEDMMGDAVGLLDALGIDSAHIAGVSMGGMIAQLAAIHHPRRIRTLTSIMSTADAIELHFDGEPALSSLLAPMPTDHDAYVNAFMEACRIFNGPHYPVERDGVLRLAEDTFRRGVYPAGSMRQLAALITAGSRRDDLKALSIPTLIIHGSDDPLLPVACGVAAAETIPGARLLIIEGVGHSIPVQVWSRIIDGIDELARAGETGA